MQATANITSHNARIGHIRKFVCAPPERGHVLKLVSIEEPPCVLGEWSRSACVDNGSSAVDVDARLTEHTQTIQEDLKFTLTWLAEDGTLIQTKRLACRYVPEVGGDDFAAQSEALGIIGTERGLVVQMQRHTEAMTRTYLSAHQTQVQMLGTLVRDLGGMVNAAHTASHTAHAELDKQRLLHRKEIELIADQAIPAEVEGDAREEMMKQVVPMVMQALPLIMKGAMTMVSQYIAAAHAQGTPNPTPPTPQQPPQAVQ